MVHTIIKVHVKNNIYRVPNHSFPHNWSRTGFDQLCWHNFRILEGFGGIGIEHNAI